MTDGTSIAGQADAIASRLRMRQVDFADDSPESRRSFLEKEIRDCLAKLRPNEDDDWLAAAHSNLSWPGGTDSFSTRSAISANSAGSLKSL